MVFKKWWKRTVFLCVLGFISILTIHNLDAGQYPKVLNLRQATQTLEPNWSSSICSSNPWVCKVKNSIEDAMAWDWAAPSPPSSSICSVDNVTALNISRRQVKAMSSAQDFFDYVERPRKKCHHMLVFGGAISTWRKQVYVDGDKMICLDPEYNFYKGSSGERQLRDSNASDTCIVYSFGINNEWSFDKAVSDFGCKVFAFDPTMKYIKNKPDPVKFHRIGIGASDDTAILNGQPCKILRFGSILKLLGHNRPEITIDYFKIDVEGAELGFLEDVLNHSPHLLNRITQIGMEIHLGKYAEENYPIFHRFYTYFQQLENHGFTLIFSAMNPVPANRYFLSEVQRTVNGYYELVWARDCTRLI